MVRPVRFTYNAQTAINNAFQLAGSEARAQEKALQEFDAFVQLLLHNGVDVLVIEDTPEPHTPDSIFPNNWISFHRNGQVVLYPMYAPNRRLERKPAILQNIQKRFKVKNVLDLSGFEQQEKFLEGTGSLVLDRDKHIAYACLSPRTNEKLLDKFCLALQYRKVAFEAVDKEGKPIYHTNVMMCVADRYVVICLDAIRRQPEQREVKEAIASSAKELIGISMEQMNAFAGNMLQINNDAGEKLLVMSSRAYGSLTPAQLTKLESYNRILQSPLDTIETNGGGSARCMMAEIHLPIQK